MKKIVTVILVLSTTNLVFAQELKFRNFSFGTAIESIIQAEGNPDNEYSSNEGNSFGNTVIEYKEKQVAGYTAKTQMEFDFHNADFNLTGLIAGTYSFIIKNKINSYGINDPTEFIVNIGLKLPLFIGQSFPLF